MGMVYRHLYNSWIVPVPSQVTAGQNRDKSTGDPSRVGRNKVLASLIEWFSCKASDVGATQSGEDGRPFRKGMLRGL